RQMRADHSETVARGEGPAQRRPQGVDAQTARAAGCCGGAGDPPSSARTSTLSAAPEPSITVTRAKPAPSSEKNSGPCGCGATGVPLTRTVTGAKAPAILRGKGAALTVLTT